MALGLFVWVAWISLLLDSSAGFTVAKGDSFRPAAASQNLVEHDDFNTLSFDEGSLDTSDEKPTELVYTSYNKPSVPKPLNLAPTGQIPPTSQSTPDVDRIVNGELRRWESKLFDPITFPLSGGAQKADLPKLPAIQPQSTPLSVYTSSKPDAPTLSRPTSHKPAQSSPLAVSSPVFESWQPASAPQIPGSQRVAGAPLGSRYQKFNTQSGLTGADSSNKLNALFERGYPYGSTAARPVSMAYTTSSNAAEEMGKGSSMNELPQSYTAVRYGLGNPMDTTRYTSAPQKPSLKYPLVNTRPYEALPYAAERYRLDDIKNREFPTVYSFPQRKPSQYPSANAMSELSFDDGAESYSQGNMGKRPSTAYSPPPRKPFSQSAVGPESSPKDWMEVPSFSSIFGNGFPDFNQMDALSENSVFNMKGSVPQKVYQMAPLKQLRKNFVVRTKNSYQRGRYLKSKTTYSPDIKMSKMSVFKGPAQAERKV